MNAYRDKDVVHRKKSERNDEKPWREGKYYDQERSPYASDQSYGSGAKKDVGNDRKKPVKTISGIDDMCWKLRKLQEISQSGGEYWVLDYIDLSTYDFDKKYDEICAAKNCGSADTTRI